MNSPGANAVACDAVDPYSLQPELKHAAVEIARIDRHIRWPSFAAAQAVRRTGHDAGGAGAQLARLPLCHHSAFMDAAARSLVFRAAAKERGRGADCRTGYPVRNGWPTMVPSSMRRPATGSPRKAIAATAGCSACDCRRDGGPGLAETGNGQDELEAGLIRLALAPCARPPVTMAPREHHLQAPIVSDVQINKNWPGAAGWSAPGQAEMRHLLRLLRARHQAPRCEVKTEETAPA